jgi:hypothetical protein
MTVNVGADSELLRDGATQVKEIETAGDRLARAADAESVLTRRIPTLMRQDTRRRQAGDDCFAGCRTGPSPLAYTGSHHR